MLAVISEKKNGMKDKFIKALYLTYENAQNLFDEATILKDNNKFGRSYTLFHLSFEECGRFHLINSVFLEYVTGKLKAKDLNYGTLIKRGYEKHNRKISESFKGMYQMALISLFSKSKSKSILEFENENNGEIEYLTKGLSELLKNENELNKMKNEGLYVTFSNNDFHLPDDNIKAGPFFRIQKLAKIALDVSKKSINFAENKGGFEKLKELYEKGL